MLSAVLFVLVVLGIAWPFLERRGLLPEPIVQAVHGGLERVNLRPVRQDGGMADPNAGLVATTREELCPQCTSLNPVGQIRCVECNAPLEMTGVSAVLKSAGREEFFGEVITAGGLLLLMVVAMALANNLPLWGKGMVLTATIGLLAFRFLKTNGN